MGLYQTFHPLVFLWSLLWGVYIYLVYEALHFVRIMLGERKAVTIICDLLFMVVSDIFMFIFSLAYNFGQLRIYMLIGAFLSFVFLKLTVGRLILTIFKWFYKLISRISKNLLKFFKKLTNKLLKFHSILVYNLLKIKDKKNNRKKV